MYVCQKCKGENVEGRTWVDCNISNPDRAFLELENSDTRCRDCEEHTGVEFVNEEERAEI